MMTQSTVLYQVYMFGAEDGQRTLRDVIFSIFVHGYAI